jgi:AcrR family transcriptional regulator
VTENMKSKLLCVACDVIAQRGVEGMRTRHVAEAAGVSTALLHYHYGSKRDLIFASFGYSDDLAIATIRSRVDTHANGREQLEQLLLAWASDDDVMQRHWIVWTEIWRWSLFEPELRGMVAVRHTRFIESIARCIAQGKDDDSIADDVNIADASQRLAACSDSFGDQVTIGLKSPGEARVALLAAMDHECPRVRPRAGS